MPGLDIFASAFTHKHLENQENQGAKPGSAKEKRWTNVACILKNGRTGGLKSRELSSGSLELTRTNNQTTFKHLQDNKEMSNRQHALVKESHAKPI